MVFRILRNIHFKNHRRYIQKLIGGYLKEEEEKKFKKVYTKCKYCKKEIGELMRLSGSIDNLEEIPEIKDDFYKKAVESLYYVEHRSDFKNRLEAFLKEEEKHSMFHAVRFAFYSVLIVIILVLPLYLNIFSSFSRKTKQGSVKSSFNKVNVENINKNKNLEDLILLTNYFSGNISNIPQSKLKDMDLNRDGKINTVDMTLLLHKELGDLGK